MSNQDKQARIDVLIDLVAEAVESPRNKARGHLKAQYFLQMEDPNAWISIYGYDANELFRDPYFYIEQVLKQKLWRWENFPDDELPLTMEMPAWLSHYPEFTLFGLDVGFDAYGVPVFSHDQGKGPLLRDPDLSQLKPVDFYSSGWMPRCLRWHEEILRIVGGRMQVPYMMEWWRGCLDLAIALRGYENFIADVMLHPQFIHDLLGLITEQRCRWHDAYWKHFALAKRPANLGDDWVNVPFITPDFFADFVLPCYKEMEAFHGGMMHIHSCGNQVPVQKYLLELETLAEFEIGPWSDLEQSLQNIPPDKKLCLSLHPNDILCATEAEMEARLQGISSRCQGRNYIIQTSGLTPIQHDVERLIKQVGIWTKVVKKMAVL